MDTKILYEKIYKENEYNYGGYNNEMQKIKEIDNKSQLNKIKFYIQLLEIKESDIVLELGCGYGHNNKCHSNWKGYEYSSEAIKIGKKIYGNNLNIYEADARFLPEKDNTVDLIYTFDVLEHIPELERAFEEISRVLKPGGVAILGPAWNCREWTVKKLQQRPYSELSLKEKIGKFLIPIRENLIFRMFCALPRRVFLEVISLWKNNIKLIYRELYPDFSLWKNYPHIADDDAFISIDAHSAICWFRSRNFKIKSHPNFISRFSCRGEELVVVKQNV
jgi:SAM-dependent methyltransferase